METHLTGFIVYTLAMLGLISLAFIVAKKSMSNSFGKIKRGFLDIEAILPVDARKSVYLLKAGKERFLISSDINGIRFLTKLEEDNVPIEIEQEEGIASGSFKDYPITQFLNFNNPANPLNNILRNFINRK